MNERERLNAQAKIFTLILAGGDSNKQRAAELIRKLSPAERGDLRAACSEVDYLLDDVWFDELKWKRHAKREE